MERYLGLNTQPPTITAPFSYPFSLEPSNYIMVGASLNSTHNLSLKPNAAPSTVKFLCSYGGKILPRYPDGKLRYHGGQTRVLSVPRSVSFAELLVKMGELCGASVSLRCQLPSEDLDALISITSEEDLANLIEEYDRASSSLKIRAFLSPPKSAKKISPPPSRISFGSPIVSPSSRPQAQCTHQNAKPLVYQKHAPGKVPQYPYLVHNGNHWL